MRDMSVKRDIFRIFISCDTAEWTQWDAPGYILSDDVKLFHIRSVTLCNFGS